jgi:hypothetical protein
MIGFNDIVFTIEITEATENRFSMKKRFFLCDLVNSVVLIRSDVEVEDPPLEDRRSASGSIRSAIAHIRSEVGCVKR